VRRVTLPAQYSADVEVDGNRCRQLLSVEQAAELDLSGRVATAATAERSFRVLRSKTSLRQGEQALVVSSGVDLRSVDSLCELKGVKWVGSLAAGSPDDVRESLKDAFRFVAEDPDNEVSGLRDPQAGAVHAVLGYWTTRVTDPVTVVMPTGTGKTETMLALFCSSRLFKLLVLVPSDVLRDQVAAKFESYGVLQQFGVVSRETLRPVVGRMKHGFKSASGAESFASACNVLVATPSALDASVSEARTALLAQFTHLFIDEAHHVPAATWQAVRLEFEGRSIVQFTATPYREDGRHLGGRILYAFPLREAQRQNYYSRINYVSVFNLENREAAVAARAIQQLREDIANGYDHLLMARVKWITRAEDVRRIYASVAPEFNPVVIHSRLPMKARQAALAAVASRDSRIIVCVDMFGEGFDLPNLKIAAVHDAHRSIGVTLQFVGRFARVKEEIGDATVVVSRPDVAYDGTLRQLYAEDADWNLIISDISEKTVGVQEELGEFERAFTKVPDEISIRSLLPKMSTVVYRSDSSLWDHERIVSVFPEEHLLTWPIALNPRDNVAWFVTEERMEVRWGELKTVQELTYHLYVLYWDRARRLLYINSSNNDSLHEDLAKAVCGQGVVRVRGENAFRVMAGVNRLVPTNVGVLDVRNRARRFSMHVGADVTAGFPLAEAQTKTKTNIFAFGYEGGERVSIGASQKGRVWSYRVAGSLKEWVDWCDAVGAKLLDETISVDEIMAGFIRPQAIESRPELVPLALEWPPELFFNTSEEVKVEVNGVSWPLVDVDLRPSRYEPTGPIRFAAASGEWSCEYELELAEGAMSFRPVQAEAIVISRRGRRSLSELLAESGLLIHFEQDTTVLPSCILLKLDRELPPFPLDRLVALDWSGVDLRKESQGPTRDQTSIQARVIKYVMESEDWDLVIDDDGSYEVADIVAIREEDDELIVRLVHCKFSQDDEPGARVGDLYELCGQAQKSMFWAGRPVPMFRHLIRREQNRRRRGASGIVRGSDKTLYALQDKAASGMRARFAVSVAQPGLAASKVSDGILQLLASTEVYLNETALAGFTVLCSD